jgi:hypothetical protein
MGDRSEIHTKKILIRSLPPTNIIPVTATLSSVNEAVAMCWHKIQAKKSRSNRTATSTYESVIQKRLLQLLGIKKTDGVINSTRWQEIFYSWGGYV